MELYFMKHSLVTGVVTSMSLAPEVLTSLLYVRIVERD